MFCKYCGSELLPDSNFCSRCGKIIDDVAPVEEKEAVKTDEDLFAVPANDSVGRASSASDTGFNDDMFAYAQTDSADDAERDDLGGVILKFGIMSLAFGLTGLLSLLGLIFACVAKSKVNAYIAKYIETQGRASVGKALSTAGLITSIVYTAFFTLYIFIIIIAIATGSME